MKKKMHYNHARNKTEMNLSCIWYFDIPTVACDLTLLDRFLFIILKPV